MELISTTDVLLLQLIAVGTTAYIALRSLKLWQGKQIESLIPTVTSNAKEANTVPLPTTRVIHQALELNSKQCVVFYGSQTGTAERLAFQFSKEAKVRFGIDCLVADPDDYNYGDLLSLAEDKLAVFILATYGEGEPTDNTVAFNRFLLSLAATNDTQRPTLRYASFGLGNSSYQYFNEMIKRVDATLIGRGCQRIGHIGLGDDNGRLEDDFETWQGATLPMLASHFHLAEKPYVYEPTYLAEVINHPPQADTFLGEPNKIHLRGRIRGPHTHANPYPAPIANTSLLCSRGSRMFLHLEMDISDSSLQYETGDHLAVRPINSEFEVGRFLHVFDWSSVRNLELHLFSRDPMVRLSVPNKVTYEALARNYLDICAPVSRRLLLLLQKFAPTRSAALKINTLITDFATFQVEVWQRRLNVSQTLQLCESDLPWSGVDLSILLETLPIMKPRYYSISSSPVIDRKTLSITTVVDAGRFGGWHEEFRGVSTSYLEALSRARARKCHELDANSTCTHKITGPRDRFSKPTCLIHIRRSAFKMPRIMSTPIIMIGPGTGVAPFRGFVQERAYRSKKGTAIGRTLLFYGCRSRDEDFLYEDDWKKYTEAMTPEVFGMYVAFSRENPDQKQYVQDLFRNHAEELRDLILNQGAYVYVCGDAHRMARDVFTRMAEILATDAHFEGSSVHAEAYLRQLKCEQRWHEDTW